MKTPFYLLLLKTHNAQRMRIRPHMEGLGLSPGQPKMLSFLRMHPGCMQRELAEGCDIEPATVSRLLENMERAGLITRQPSPDSKRAVCVSITEKGIAAQQAMATGWRKVEREALAGFTPEEKEQFTQYLCRMYGNLTGKDIE
ncbi:Salmolysin [uncultured Clostridium sp.]|nr:Salmolysin [uncultured Clostridium sp.]